jgi:integrase
MHNGKSYCITVPYKPNRKEATELINEKINNSVDKISTLEQAAKRFISVKENVLSPTTKSDYITNARLLPEWFAKMDITEIDSYVMQKYINEISATLAPKTVRNKYGFVVAVIHLFIPDAKYHVTLPQKIHKEEYIPSVEDVRALFEYAKDSEYYVALRLEAMSLRRSEVLALTIDDLNGDEITINKAYVKGENGFVIKPNPKNDPSNRTITIPHDLAERIRKQGYIYKCTPNGIDKYLRKTLPKLGIPVFSPHKLRHFFASYSHELGYSDAVIQSVGGWKTDHVMKSVYRHAMNKDQAKKSIASDFDI